ncbi:hypothetical protein EDB83DRAFT_2528620 [Lactarius deliciosus]|nr:hypothetical protein EDB83DRAFT_2528620 [Lactarius deliciosus]
MPVPSTALVTALPSLYLNSKAQCLRLHPFPLPLAVIAFAALFLTLILTLTGFVPTPARLSAQCLHPFPLPLAVFAFAALLSLLSSPLPASFPPPLPQTWSGNGTSTPPLIVPRLPIPWRSHSASTLRRQYRYKRFPMHTGQDSSRSLQRASPTLSVPPSSVSLQTPPDAHGPGLIKVASAEPSPIKAPVIHHSHSISTSAKPKTVAQGRSLPTNLPPLVALDLYLTNIVGLTSAVVITPGKSTFAHLPLSLTHSLSYASYLLIHRPPIASYPSCVLSLPLASSPSSANRIIHPSLSRYPVSHLAASSVALVPPSAQGPELVKVTIYPHAHTRPITPLDPSAPSTNHSASPTHVLTSRRCVT